MKSIIEKRILIALTVVIMVMSAVGLVACAAEAEFDITGSWKATGGDGWVEKDSVIAFDGQNCNLYSPKDTYALSKDGDSYKLDLTSLLFGENISLTVKVIDNNKIELYMGDKLKVVLER